MKASVVCLFWLRLFVRLLVSLLVAAFWKGGSNGDTEEQRDRERMLFCVCFRFYGLVVCLLVCLFALFRKHTLVFVCLFMLVVCLFVCFSFPVEDARKSTCMFVLVVCICSFVCSFLP